MTNTAPIQEKEKRFHLIKEPDPYGKWSFINKLFFSKKVVSLSRGHVIGNTHLNFRSCPLKLKPKLE